MVSEPIRSSAPAPRAEATLKLKMRLPSGVRAELYLPNVSPASIADARVLLAQLAEAALSSAAKKGVRK